MEEKNVKKGRVSKVIVERGGRTLNHVLSEKGSTVGTRRLVDHKSYQVRRNRTQIAEATVGIRRKIDQHR